MRSCTDFCAPEPRATIVITAPTPMMIPSIVRSERSLLARSASSATRMISPRSIVPRRGGALRLLPQPGQPAARHVLESPPHVLLRLHERGARQHEDRVLLVQSGRHFDVVLVRETGPDCHGNRVAAAQREHDVVAFE